uniref:Uncharacterized protein n=1 Tax=Solanum lycopersicum TaxID=4081 RepID=A0A3Q7J8K0_SOLLC
MAIDKMIQALDTILKDLTGELNLFGGKVESLEVNLDKHCLLFAMEKEKTLYLRAYYSDIWNQLEKLCLSENMSKRRF